MFSDLGMKGGGAGILFAYISLQMFGSIHNTIQFMQDGG
jgi:hypothetical protein